MTSHPRTLTADAFLAWAGEEFETRYELIEGRVVAMGAERAAHGRAKARAYNALDAAIAVEVVSPSTRAIDMNARLAGYFRLPSLRHYLIIDADERTIVHHRRTESDDIRTAILREGPIALDPPGLAVTVADLLPL